MSRVGGGAAATSLGRSFCFSLGEAGCSAASAGGGRSGAEGAVAGVDKLAVGGVVEAIGMVAGGGGAMTSGLGSTAVISTSELSESLELLLLKVLTGPRIWLPKTGGAGRSSSCLTSGMDWTVVGAGSGVVSDGRIQLASGRILAGGGIGSSGPPKSTSSSGKWAMW